MKISVVVPVMNEEENLPILYRELKAVLEEVAPQDYEMIFVDDGSTDGTFTVLSALAAEDERMTVIQFRRNFGKSAALSAGFERAKGEIVITMDGDLQDDPAEIPRFLAKLEEGYDLVSGWKYPRLDPPSKTWPSRLFNLVTATVSGVHLHDFNCGFKAYRHEVTRDVNLYGELHRFIPVLAHQKGYRVTEIKVHHRPRRFGRSKFGAKRLARGFFDFLTVILLGEYRWRPMHLFGWLGLLSGAAGVAINLYLAYLWFTGHRPIGTRPLLTLGVLLITVGVQFFTIGLLAEMFAMSQSRYVKPYAIRRIVGGDDERA